ncbi:MAG TPA: PA14 domain-containing protein [Candidatus Acidoferrum sp.]|nr:PA14 domain-containing protein [Candidatus Acidoferrum sp.]
MAAGPRKSSDRFTGIASFCLAFAGMLGTAGSQPPGTSFVVHTNIGEVCDLARLEERVVCPVRVEGIALWASSERGELILQAGTNALRVNMTPRDLPQLQPGDRVRLEGSGIAGFGRLREAVVDNDGLHGKAARSERIHLPAGLHPVRLDWFNGPGPFHLEVRCEGPGFAGQAIPGAALLRAEAGQGASTNVVQGLDYRCYEGNWDRLPDFEALTPVKAGIARNFDLSVRDRDEHVGLEFRGYLRIAQEGTYTFETISDDGSRLYIGDSVLRLTRLGSGAMPEPLRAAPGLALSRAQADRWVQAEGGVTFVHKEPAGGLEVQLSAGTNSLYLDVDDASADPPPLFARLRATGICCAANSGGAARLLVPSSHNMELLAGPPSSLTPRPTSLAQLRRLNAGSTPCAARLEGTVLSTSSERGLLAFEDDSGAALVETPRSRDFQPGERIALTGCWSVNGLWLSPRAGPLVDNNGIHAMTEKSGAICLNAGKHPIFVSWFNLVSPLGLDVYCEGPGMPRQKLPDGALSCARLDPSGAALTWSHGLDYRAYTGAWLRIPNWTQLEPAGQGTAANFDLSRGVQADDSGLTFRGYFDAPRDGTYTFSTISDDGSLLSVGSPPAIEHLATNAIAAPQRIAARQILREDQLDRWSEAEGMVTFVNPRAGSMDLELSSGTGRMRLAVVDGSGGAPLLLLNSHVRARGICQSTYTTDGQRVAGALLVPTIGDLDLLEIMPRHWVSIPLVPIGSLGGTNLTATDGLAHISGQVQSCCAGQSSIVTDGTGQVRVEAARSFSAGARLEFLGRCCQAGTNVVLRCAACREVLAVSPGSPQHLPLLTTIDQIKRLSREEAGRGYPVRIRGVITAPQVGGFFIQDSTWSIYVRLEDPASVEAQQAGDYWEVEGVTFAEFAPNVRARRAVRLGPGVLPEPMRPTWDQLINGSLDTQYVELQGVVTGIGADGLALLTPAGKLTVQLTEAQPGALNRYQNARVRLRGCVIPGRDETTQEVELGRLRLSNFSINVDEPAPADPFAAPPKRAVDLLLFDPRAGAIQRVRIAGQVLHARGGQTYLCEGTNGLRAIADANAGLQPGDLVEVVGFPELGGPSPVLREAVIRRTGQAPLPPPQLLRADALVSRRYDSRRVQVQARLTGLRLDHQEQVLELQSGTRGFAARLDSRQGLLRHILPGSRLELTGVYSGQGGDLAAGRDIDSFELLLNTPADVRVLESPPWWTLRHTLTVVGGMACIILIASIWITQLRRQVEERSRQLTVEIQRREQTERQRALESERARIARDLHDDLGASLTQIRFLSALESRDAQVPESTRARLGQVTEKSREMVASLDEIVWAVNPANDSLPSLATYLCQFAEEFFRPTPIRCRLDVADSLPPVALTSEVRHHVYLAVREALNNIAKHSQATEVWLRIQWREHGLAISLEDNGRGFAHLSAGNPGDGLSNMRHRLKQLGGRFECQTQPGAGTLCRIWLPLDEALRGNHSVQTTDGHR